MVPKLILFGCNQMVFRYFFLSSLLLFSTVIVFFHFRTLEFPPKRFLKLDRWYIYMIFKHHDDVIKWKHFPRYWPFVLGIHRSAVNSPHKGQWRGALMFSFICAWINGWVNNREADDLRRHRAHYDVIVMYFTQ